MKIHQGVNYTLILYILSYSLFTSTYSQDLLMQNGTVNTCTGNFYDSGGPNGDYGGNEDFIYTICPDIPDYKILIEFIEFDIQSFGGPEALTIYDGQDTSENILAVLDVENIGPDDPSLNFTATETNLSGCLTFRFTSDAFFSNSGWNALISCIDECEATTADLLSIGPSTLNNTTNNYEVEIFAPVTIEIDPVFTDNNGNNPEFVWDFGDGSSTESTSSPLVSHSFQNTGIYTISVSITDDFACVNNDVVQIPIEVVEPSGSLCDEARQFCSEIVLPNFNMDNGGLSNAEVGPDYGCLNAQPYPSWFFFQVENSGDIAFLIEQNTDVDFTGTNLDADFKVWGPFTNAFGNCSNLNSTTEAPDLPNGNLFDGCSYSASSVENMGIQNAQTGEYYIVIVTNFSQNQGFYRFSQVNSSDPNAGSVSCTNNNFLGDDIVACSVAPVTINANIDNADSYHWEIFNDQTNNFEIISGEQSPSLTVSSPGGTYRSTVTVGSDVFQDEIVITFLELPNPPLIELIECDDDDDGMVMFDLNSAIPQIIAGTNDTFTITFHESLSDASSGTVPIAIPFSYTNLTNPQTIYFRAENQADTDCFSIGPVDLVVDDCLSLNDSRLTSGDFTIYPNPSIDGKIYIASNKLANSQSKLKIIDLNGKVVFEQQIRYNSEGKVVLNLGNLPPGIYLSVIKTNSSHITSKLILK